MPSDYRNIVRYTRNDQACSLLSAAARLPCSPQRDRGNAGDERAPRHRRPVARRLPVLPRPPGGAHAQPRPAGRRRGAVHAPLRAGDAVRPVAGLAAHRPLRAEPPLDHQRHPAGRAAQDPGQPGRAQAATTRSCSATPTPAPTRARCRRTARGCAPTRAWRRAFGSSCACPRPRRPISTTWRSAATAGCSYEEVYGGGFAAAGAVPRRGQRHRVPGRPVPRLAGPAGRRALVRPCRVPQAAPAVRGAGALVLGGRAGRPCRRRSARRRRRGRGLPCIPGSRRTWRSPSGRRRTGARCSTAPAWPGCARSISGWSPRSTTIWAASSRRWPGAASSTARWCWSPPTTARCWATTGCSASPASSRRPSTCRCWSATRTARAAAASTRFTEHVDLMPTVLDALGLQSRCNATDESLSDFLTGRTPRVLARRPPTGSTTSAMSSTGDLRAALGLPSDACGTRDALRRPACGYVHFAGLPAAVLRLVDDPAWLRRSGRPTRHARAGCSAQAQGMLSWRMLAAERRLTGCALTPEGVVGATIRSEPRRACAAAAVGLVRDSGRCRASRRPGKAAGGRGRRSGRAGSASGARRA